MVPVGIDSRPVSGATPVGGSIGAAIVVRSLAGDGLDDMVRARAEGGEGRLMSTACTMRSGAHARTCLRHRQDAGRNNRCREEGNEDGGVDGDGYDNEGRSSLIHISVGHRRSAKVPRQHTTRLAKHIVHHRSRQLAGVRILSAWVIAPDQGLTAAQGVNRPMGELRARPDDLAAQLEQLKIRVERDLAERDDHLHARQRRDLARRDAEGICAISSGFGLLSGGAQRTAAAINASVSVQPVVRMLRRRDVREPARDAARPSGNRPSRRSRRR